jgi:polysaccharide export outer membrane protein
MARRTAVLDASIGLIVVCLAGAVPAGQAIPVAGPRDVLTIAVFGEPTMTGEFAVDPDGAFEFPLIGRVVAAGLSARELEMYLVKRLADGYLKNPQVTVGLEQAARVRVFVMGEVRTPGAYQLAGDVTLIEALSRAGSTTTAAAQEALVLRPREAKGTGPILPAGQPSGDGAADAQSTPEESPDAEVIRIDLRELQTGVLRNNIALRDGDTVFVPKAQLVYVTGQVRSPGAYPVEPGMTVLQVLSLGGGVTDRGAASRIRIIRMVNGQSRTIGVDLTDTVEPGDTVVVPERFF